MKIVDKKEQLLAKGAEVIWHPEYMRVRLNQWIEGLKEDWCISRQIWFGHRIPAWRRPKADVPSDSRGIEDGETYGLRSSMMFDKMIYLGKTYEVAMMGFKEI